MNQTQKSKMRLQEWLPLCGMTFSAFIFNTSEFMPIGLLSDIAADFSVSEAHAGMLISVYAWVVMLLSLPLMLLASKVDFKKLLLGTLLLFGVFQVLSVISASYWMLMFARIGVACTHAIFWSIASPLAVRVVSEEHRPLALSMIATGTSIAMIAGMPIGRMIGLFVGWRVTFLCVAAAAFAVLFYQFFVFPKVKNADPFSLSELPKLLQNKVLIAEYVLTLLMVTGYYTGYSYIEPFLSQVGGLSDGSVTETLTLFGAAGLIGSFLYARFYSKMPLPFIRAVLISIAAVLFLLLPAASSHLLLVLLCAIWGIAVTAFGVIFQGEIIHCAPESASAVAMSIYSGIFNLGIGCGTFFGGMVTGVAEGSIRYIGFVGGIIAAAAVLFGCFCYLRRLKAYFN